MAGETVTFRVQVRNVTIALRHVPVLRRDLAADDWVIDGDVLTRCAELAYARARELTTKGPAAWPSEHEVEFS